MLSRKSTKYRRPTQSKTGGFNIVEVTFWSALKHSLTYSVPGDIPNEELLGRRVIAPVRTSKRVGVITSLVSGYKGRLKQIDSFPDSEPVLSLDELQLCKTVSDYYFAPLGDCLKAFLPQPLTVKLNQRLEIVSAQKLRDEVDGGTQVAAKLLKLFGNRKSISVNKLSDINRNDLKDLIERDVVAYNWKARGSRRADKEYQIQLASDVDHSQRLGPRAKTVIEYLVERQVVDLDQLRLELGIAKSTIDRLLSRGLVTLTENPPFIEKENLRDSFKFELNSDQKQAVTEIKQYIKQGGFTPFLLYGVTGSGKTEVYIEAVKAAIGKGKQAIIIVPEIGLSQAMYFRLRETFGHQIALVHSRLSPRSRLDIWRQARAGKLKVILGPRSAVFSSLPNLGLIVVDEEHEQALKQSSPAPRYHARDLAVLRARLEGCVVILGSATPSVESYYNTQIGKYKLLTLPHRVDRRNMPQVSIVDLRESFQERGYGYLTDQLIEVTRSTLTEGGQVMLLLNRRGFAPSVHCFDCGHKFMCQNCAVSLVYHKAKNVLLCHVCGYSEKYPQTCPSCNSNLFLYRGIGTQKLQEELHAHFPDTTIIRMDLDSTRRRGSFQEVYDRFRFGEAQILIGTQMIAKGFDFPDVALMIVVSADTALEFPDFRARERTFQLLTQASGRAGRLSFPGQVLFQTLHSDEKIIAMAAEQDYLAFYQTEISERSELDFPPYMHLILIEINSPEEETVRKKAESLVRCLQAVKQQPFQVLGPIPAPIYKRINLFRYHILLKTNKVKTTLAYLKKILESKTLQKRRKLSIIVDVDAIDMM